MRNDTTKDILARLTLDEKINLLNGRNFWDTQEYPDAGLPSFSVADGPYGLRKQTGISDHMGWNESLPSTAYVAGHGAAASWNRSLIREMGRHLGNEAKTNDVDILLGPAINIVRSPLCGRNFEYYSEDPLLTSEIATAYIEGVQSQGVGTCVKHFAANNQERDREYISAEVEERALREIYLAAFEHVVKYAKPTAVMTALNRLNGVYCSENEWLLNQTLRDDWGFEGFVMSDWNGVNDRAKALKAGLDLEMPCSYGIGEERIRLGMEMGIITEDDIDSCCERLIDAALNAAKERQNPSLACTDHHDFCHGLAEECIVLLKNEADILPIDERLNLAVLGDFAMKPQFQMEGSALVNPTRRDIPLEEIKKIAKGQVSFGQGYTAGSDEEQERLLRQAEELAAAADVAVLFVGLPPGIEAEGRDREDIHLPRRHTELIERVGRVQSRLIVVLCNGSVVDMPWLDHAKGVFECFLAGQAMGGAIASLLYGRACPSAKLPVTFPRHIAHTPSHLHYPGFAGKSAYPEGVFVGYRYYDTKRVEPLFPFGYGLSYTTFTYSDLRLSSSEITDEEQLEVSLQVKNTGDCAGMEVVQLYVAPPEGGVPIRPLKELRGFEKVSLEAGETKEVTFLLDARAFSYYDEELRGWYAPEGRYEILCAASSLDIRLRASINVSPICPKFREIKGWSTVGHLSESEAGRKMLDLIRRKIRESGKVHLLKLPIFDDSGESAERVAQLPLRMITLLSDNVINNDIMDRLIADCNRAHIETVRGKMERRINGREEAI
ncbi:MAG: glycoside hydrolase family 3 C-terminal domain-containing protein [Clostridiales Family XIII bacterium]|nr:glycoside hydrolase family 3 C-terminal domain-containing protein [Clostridiales Family XIII bacterium]